MGVWLVLCGDQSLQWILSRASSLLCGCHSPVGDRVCSPVVGVEAPRYISKLLQCEIGKTGVLPLGEKPLPIPPQELFARRAPVVLPVTRAVSQSMLLLALPLAPPQSWECWQSTWVTLGRCAHKTSSADPLKSGTWTVMVAHLDPPWELQNQPRPQCHLYICMPTKLAAANARLAPATGSPVICLDVPQVLSLQSCQQWHKSTDWSAAGTQLRFQPHLQVWAALLGLHAPRTHRGRATPAVNTQRLRLLWWGLAPPFAWGSPH